MPKTMNDLIQKIKQNPRYHDAGMILCHNGVVRNRSRSGQKVTGLRVQVDETRLKHVLEQYRSRPGIIDIIVDIRDGRELAVGDDVMLLAVAGDVRENVIAVLSDALNDIKKTVTRKTEHFA